MNIPPVLFVLIAEVAGLATLALIAMLIFSLRRQRRERRVLSSLVARIRKQEDGWREQLAGVLQQKGHLNEEEAATQATALLKQRNDVYKQFTSAYLERNAALLSNVDNALDKLLESYRESLSAAASTTAAEDTVSSTKHAEVSAQLDIVVQQVGELRAENERLQSELSAAQADIERTMREYVSVFRSGGGAPAQPVAAQEKDVKPSDSSNSAAAAPATTVNSASQDTPDADAFAAMDIDKLLDGVRSD